MKGGKAAKCTAIGIKTTMTLKLSLYLLLMSSRVSSKISATKFPGCMNENMQEHHSMLQYTVQSTSKPQQVPLLLYPPPLSCNPRSSLVQPQLTL